MRRLVVLLALVAGCGGGGEAAPTLLLLPTSPGEPPEVTVVDAVPGDDGRCGEAQQDRWAQPPTRSPVVAIPGAGFTYSLTAPDEAGASLTVVCDLDPDGTLLVADELQTTGTDQSVGNDYISRVGALSGRVDVGVPDGAAVALQRFDAADQPWTLRIPLAEGMDVLRLHALASGDAEEGYDVGTVSFLTADGTDVTAASVPLPDVVHGVPRARGSAVDD